MNKIPTPINDKFTAFMNGVDDTTHLVALDLLSRDLERQLTIARDALKIVRDDSSSTRLVRIANESLTATAPK